MRTSIVIGLMIGTIALPMIVIPLMGIGAVLWGFYVLFHDIVWPSLHHHHHADHRHTQ